MEAVLDTIRKTEGVWRVYRKEELSATDPLTRAAGAQPLRRPQRRHQDARPRLLDHVGEHDARTAPAIATTRTCR